MDMLDIDVIWQMLPLLIIISLIELILMIVALVHLIKHKNPKHLSLTIWVLLIVFIQIIGPVLYLVMGRNDEVEDDRYGDDRVDL